MKAALCVLLLALAGFGCARIYRPVTLLALPATVRGPGLSGQVVLQPWGDNSRYERRALNSHLRVAVLTLENPSEAEVEVVRLELPDDAILLSHETALTLVRQRALGYLSFSLIPGILALGSGGDRYGVAIFGAMGVIGLGIGLPNTIIASRSNRHLGDFFRDVAWSPGPLGPGQIRRGLIFIRSRDPYAAVPIRVIHRNPTGDRRLELVCPGIPPH